jgi:hypothetical protein
MTALVLRRSVRTRSTLASPSKMRSRTSATTSSMTVIEPSTILDLLTPPDLARRGFLIAQLPEPGEPRPTPTLTFASPRS